MHQYAKPGRKLLLSNTLLTAALPGLISHVQSGSTSGGRGLIAVLEFTARGDLVYSTSCAKSLCVLEPPLQGTEALPVQTRWWDQFLHAWQAEHGVLPRQLVIYISGDLQSSPSRSGPASLPCL